MHGESPIKRRESRKIWVGNVPVGGDAPIAVQSMTNTDTNDVAATVAQIQRLVDAGVDIVRVSVPDMDAAEAFGKIKQLVSVPLVADIHFDYKIALRVAELGVDCLRINPGNIGREDRVRAVVDAARDRGIPIRIASTPGPWKRTCRRSTANRPRRRWWSRPCATSSTSTAWTSRTSRSASRHPMCSWPSKLPAAGQADRAAAAPGHHRSGWPAFRDGEIRRRPRYAAGRGHWRYHPYLACGRPGRRSESRYDILKSLHLRSRGINFIACPSCSRQNFDVVKTMNELEGRLEDLLVPLDVAVIGCVVNGPGEAKEAHVGLTGGTPNLIYIDGKPAQKLTNDNLVDELERLIRQKAAEKVEADAALIARG